MDDSSQEDAPFDPARRKLCPDGTCVGVIGDDGRCRVCGRTEAEAEAGAEPVGSSDVGTSDAGGSGDVGSSEGGGGEPGGFDSTRRLCDDGSCVGVVGDDGVCRVCGRRSE